MKAIEQQIQLKLGINLGTTSRADQSRDKKADERIVSANVKTENVDNYEMCFPGRTLI